MHPRCTLTVALLIAAAAPSWGQADTEVKTLKRTLEQCRSDIEAILKQQAGLRTQLDALEAQTRKLEERLAQALAPGLDAATLQKMKSTADEQAALAGSDLDRAMSAYEPAILGFSEWFKGRKMLDPTDPLAGLYRNLLASYDDLAERLCTPEYIATAPTRHLLSPFERTSGVWGASPGIGWEFTDQGIVAWGMPVQGREEPDKPSIPGILSIDGWTKPWWDLQLDLEFELVEGQFDLFLRYRPDGHRFWACMFAAGEGGYEAGRAYHLTIRVTGSTLFVHQPDWQPRGERLPSSVSRTGGIGFGIPVGSRIRIRDAKLKLLRPRGG